MFAQTGYFIANRYFVKAVFEYHSSGWEHFNFDLLYTEQQKKRIFCTFDIEYNLGVEY